MHIKNIHHWDCSPKEAIALQKELAQQISHKTFNRTIKTVCGLDCAFTRDERIVSCAVVLKYPEMELLETSHAVNKIMYPYIPGLLSFREAPTCLDALSNLTIEPDVIIVDGHGIAHPRRLGIASHIGLFVDVPTIGCAKKRLIGEYEMPPQNKGSFSPLNHKDDEIGVVLRTRDNVKPVFVSIGNNCSLEQAKAIVLTSATQYRLPEPTRLADKLVAQIKLRV